MTDRAFQKKSVRHGSGYVKQAMVHCGACGATEAINISTADSVLPSQVIAKKFAAKGWKIGGDHNSDLCPAHINRPKKEKPELKIVAPAPIQPPSETPPRILSRDDRRIIFSKLDEVYLDDRRGYDNGWSDQRVSDDLGVPRAWVEAIRKENFGDAAGNDEARQLMKDAEQLLLAARHEASRAQNLRDEAQAILNRVLESAKAFPSDFGTRLARIERTANDLRKLLP